MTVKKSKFFWTIMIFANITIVSASGYVVYTRLNILLSPQIKKSHTAADSGITALADKSSLAEPAEKDKPSVAAPAMKDKPASKKIYIQAAEKKDDVFPGTFARKQSLAAVPAEKQAAKINGPGNPSVIETAQKNANKIKALKHTFKYKNSTAKSVSVSGSFTKWKNIKMEKKNGIWKTDIWILPGTYLFHYVVDGKKTLDSSAPKASMGESIIDIL